MFSSLYSRLLSTHLLVAVVALSLVGLLSTRLFRHYYVTQTREALAESAEDMAADIARLMDDPDRIEQIGMIARTASLTLGGRVCVFDHEREGLIASSDLKPGAGSGPDIDELLCAAGTCSSIDHTRSYCYPGPVISITTPIRRPGENTVRGSLILRRPLREVETTLRTATGLFIASGAAAAILALVLAAMASRSIARPLAEVAHAASDLADGDFTARVRRQGPLELRTVAASLNHMTDALATAFADLSREREQLADILASMHEGVVGLAPDGSLVMLNEGARELLELPELPDNAALPDLGLPEDALADVQLLLNGESESFARDMERGERILRLRGARISAAAGGAVVVITDITETERLERLRREFVANASHELRAPLTSIRGYLGALADGTAETEEERQRCVRVASDQADLMRRLVDQLLDLSRLQAGVVAFEPEDLDVTTVVNAAVDALTPAATAASVGIEYQRPDPLTVRADGDRLVRVVINLVHNAIRHSPPGGKVRVSAEQLDGPSPGQVCVLVEDEGPGVPPEHLAHIWERFHKVDKSRGPADTGAGLGLAIAREIIAAHGGSVFAENRPEGGARFGFILPLNDGESE